MEWLLKMLSRTRSVLWNRTAPIGDLSDPGGYMILSAAVSEPEETDFEDLAKFHMLRRNRSEPQQPNRARKKRGLNPKPATEPQKIFCSRSSMSSRHYRAIIRCDVTGIVNWPMRFHCQIGIPRKSHNAVPPVSRRDKVVFAVMVTIKNFEFLRHQLFSMRTPLLIYQKLISCMLCGVENTANFSS